MGLVLESGGTFPYKMSVDKEGRASVMAAIHPELSDKSKDGRSYCISSGEVALTTTGAYSGILQVKNTSTQIMNVAIFCMGGDMAHAWWQVIRNPGDTGTLWTTGATLTPKNANFSSGGVFPAVGGAKSGFDGATQVGGELMNPFPTPLGEFTKVLDGAIILGPENSIAFLCKPSAAGTVHTSMLVYFDD